MLVTSSIIPYLKILWGFPPRLGPRPPPSKFGAGLWCFWFSANGSSIENVCPTLVYTMCKEALLPTKRIFAANAPSKDARNV